MSKHEIAANKMIDDLKYQIDYFGTPDHIKLRAIAAAIYSQKRVIKTLKRHGIIDDFQNAIYKFLVVQDKK